MAALDGGMQIVISNDSDFGIAGVTNNTPPWQLQAKISPATGQQDDGEYLEIDMDKLVGHYHAGADEHRDRDDPRQRGLVVSRREGVGWRPAVGAAPLAPRPLV